MKEISQGILKSAIANKKTMRALSLAFAIKANFRSSQFNSFTYSRVAEMFHIGRETAKHLIEELHNMGLIENRGPNILIRSLKDKGIRARNRKIQDYSNVDISNLKEVEKFLRLQGVLLKQSQIDYAANIQKDILSPRCSGDYRRAKRESKKMGHWSGEADRGQSISTVMKASGLRRNSAINLLKWGEKSGLLIKKKRMIKIGAAMRTDDFSIGRTRIFSWENQTYVCKPTELTFCRVV
jgi:hypothetical protein